MALKLITAPADYPVSLAEAKAHLRVDFSDDNDLIDAYRKAATEDVENFTGRALYDQTWDYYLDAIPDSGVIKIPKPPLIEVVGVFIDDSVSAIDSAIYRVDLATAPGRLALADGASWPTPVNTSNAVRVRFRAGYIDADQSPPAGEVPWAIKAAILMTIGTLYANRETVVIGQAANLMPWAAEQLLRKGDLRVHTAIG